MVIQASIRRRSALVATERRRTPPAATPAVRTPVRGRAARAATLAALLLAALPVAAGCGSTPTASPSLAPASPVPTATPTASASPLASPTATPPAVPGIDWARIPDQPSFDGAIAQGPWAARGTSMHDVIALDDGSWLAVGADARGGAVWRSADGLTWERAPDQASLDQGWIRSVIRTPEGFLAVGSLDSFLAGAWRSDDGLAWSRVVSREAFEFRGGGQYVIEDVVRTPEGYVAVGFVDGEGELSPAVIWTSVDGTAWTRPPDEVLPMWGRDALRAVATDGTQLVAVGSFIAVSTDGRQWSRPIDVAEAETVGYDLEDVVHAPSLGAFFAVGSIGGEEVTQAVALRSADGRSWTRLTLDAPPLTRLSAVGTDGSAVVAAGTAGRWLAVGSDRGAEDYTSAAVAWSSPPVTGTPGGEAAPVPVVEGAFSALPPLPEPASPVLVGLGDGSVLALGTGEARTGVLRLGPTSGGWTALEPGPWPEGSWIAATVGPDGAAYVLTSSQTEGAGTLLSRFDPAAGTWSRRAAPIDGALPERATLAAGADGRVYLFGQWGWRAVLAYDPGTDRWQERQPMPLDSGLTRVAVARPAQGDIVLVTAERAWHYDPAADTWRPGAPTPMVGWSFTAVTVGDTGAVAMLREQIVRCDIGLSGSRVELYRADGTWAIGPALPRSPVSPGAAWSESRGGVVLAGGSESAEPCSEEANGPFATVELLRLETE